MTRSSNSDEKLFLRIRAGDARAFHELHNKYKKPLYALIRKIMNNHEDTEDVVQDVFTKLWSIRSSIEIRHAGLLFTIATRKALDAVERKNRWTEQNQPVDDLPEAAQPRLSEPEVLEESELTRTIKDCLELLRKKNENRYLAIILKDKELTYLLFHADGDEEPAITEQVRKLSDAEIAKDHNTTNANVAKWRERGRRDVSDCIRAKAKRNGFGLPSISYLT